MVNPRKPSNHVAKNCSCPLCITVRIFRDLCEEKIGAEPKADLVKSVPEYETMTLEEKFIFLRDLFIADPGILEKLHMLFPTIEDYADKMSIKLKKIPGEYIDWSTQVHIWVDTPSGDGGVVFQVDRHKKEEMRKIKQDGLLTNL